MYLIDTNVISEARKGAKSDPGVRSFFDEAITRDHQLYLSAVTIGELRRGVERIRHRGDKSQADRLEAWLQGLLDDYGEYVLALDTEVAEVWGRLRVPHHENALDKQIAATALVYDLILVTRNTTDFSGTGVRLINPFGKARIGVGEK